MSTLSAPLHLPRTSESDQLLRIRHSCSHVMAMAVQRLFKNVQVTIGPWTETGFYYDFDAPEPFTPQDLKKIRKGMQKILRQNLPFRREEVSRQEARRRIEAIGEPYKLEILDDLREPITLYHLGDQWWDLCAGPHVANTSEINPDAVDLETVAGAYWRGDETKAQLQRIYGTAFETPEQLAEHQRRQEEAQKRDHRRLGRELGLFLFSDSVGPGLPLWTPRGTQLRSLLKDYLRQQQQQRGYQHVVTPHIARVDLFRTSGHWQNYREDMFPLMAENDSDRAAEEGFVMKPMNCPFHAQIYKAELRSYRDLPYRLAEFGTVYRYEQSGELGGLTRARGFTQDDSHLFVTPEQLDEEFRQVVDLILTVFQDLEFRQFKARLSFRGPQTTKMIGRPEAWDQAEAAIRQAVNHLGIDTVEGPGEAAFYGPKLDFLVYDSLGREWQLGTVQVDYNLPERFDLEYVAADGSRQRPMMLHRAIFGSLERFIGILIEDCGGDFPFWLAPEQIRILPVTTAAFPAAQQLAARLCSHGVRAAVASSGERLGKLIRNGETRKIPVLGILGEQEMEADAVSLRTRRQGDLGTMGQARLVELARDAVASRRATLVP